MEDLASDVKKALELVDSDELVRLAVEMGNIHGPSGYEADVGEFIYGWLRENGLDAAKQEISEGRFNIIGSVRGTGGGASLIFDGHMDSEITPRHNAWVGGTRDDRIEKAWVDGDRIFGHAVMNDRGPVAAFMVAARAIRRSGLMLKGDLILAAVAGEIGMAPVDEFQGPRYVGKGLGTRHLVDHGVLADYAIVAETSDFGVTWAECGACYIKITVKGQMMYTPRSFRTEDYRTHPNAIVKMAAVVQAIEKWAIRYEERSARTFEGGTILPKVAIGAVRGGLPYKPNRTVGSCSMYLDVRLLPGEGPEEVQRELQGLVADLGVEAEVRPYLFRKGHVGQGVEPLLRSIERAYGRLRGESLPPVPTHVTSMWRDINVFNSVGVPAVTFGPPRRIVRDASGRDARCLYREDLADTARLYALIAMDLCGGAGPQEAARKRR